MEQVIVDVATADDDSLYSEVEVVESVEERELDAGLFASPVDVDGIRFTGDRGSTPFTRAALKDGGSKLFAIELAGVEEEQALAEKLVL